MPTIRVESAAGWRYINVQLQLQTDYSLVCSVLDCQTVLMAVRIMRKLKVPENWILPNIRLIIRWESFRFVTC